MDPGEALARVARKKTVRLIARAATASEIRKRRGGDPGRDAQNRSDSLALDPGEPRNALAGNTWPDGLVTRRKACFLNVPYDRVRLRCSFLSSEAKRPTTVCMSGIAGSLRRQDGR